MRRVLRFPVSLHSEALIKTDGAAKVVLFGHQPDRGQFSVWLEVDEGTSPTERKFLVVPTGEYYDGKQVASTLMQDGFHVFHLVEV
jgi:hypothetical protein